MKVRLLIFALYSTLFLGCKKLVEAPKETCFIPYVDFVAYNVNPNTLEVSFTSIIATNGTITSHTWDFGDGTTYSGDTPPPHKYPIQTSATETKTYRIKYTVANACGEAYWTNDIKISPCLPDVKFTYTLLNDSTVQFTNTTKSATPVTYEWNFGDGTKSTSNASAITKTYLFDGRYTATLKATNACGDNYYLVVIPVCSKPMPSQKVTLSGCSTVLVDASATRNGQQYQWDFGNGTILPASPSTSSAISYTYPSSGSYVITLKVINKNACDSATTTTRVNVEAPNVVANNNWAFSSDDLDFNFSRTAVTNATSYLWKFGDGTTASEQNPARKTFFNPGVYDLTLIAANTCGDYSFTTSLNVPFYKPVNNTPNADFREVVVVSAFEIYFLSTNGKLYKTDTAGHWSAIDLPSSLKFNNDTKLFKDINNNLWIYGRSEVAKFNSFNQSWTSFFASTGYSRNTTINSIAIDNSGNLWSVDDKDVRRNNKKINDHGNNHFTSIAFAPTTGRLWVTASGRNALHFVNSNSNQLNQVNIGGTGNNADNIKVHSNGDIYFTTGSGIVRANSTGNFLNSYTASNTNGVLEGTPKKFCFDNEGNMWVVNGGRILKVPIGASNNTKNYSFTQELNSVSSIDVLNVADVDNDIIVAKTTGHAAIQIK